MATALAQLQFKHPPPTLKEPTAMDMVYQRALNNASQAWSQQRVVDAQSLAILRRGEAQPTKVSAPAPAQQALLQPELARFGLLGTKLNLFA